MTAPITIGVDLSAVFTRFDRTDAAMATINEVLTELKAQSEANAAAVADLVADVRALIDQLRNQPPSGELTAEQQALVDSIAAKLNDVGVDVAALDAEVGDADGSDTPPPSE